MVHLDSTKAPKVQDKTEPKTETTDTSTELANGSSSTTLPVVRTRAKQEEEDGIEELKDQEHNANISDPSPSEAVKPENMSGTSNGLEPIKKENIPPHLANSIEVKQEQAISTPAECQLVDVQLAPSIPTPTGDLIGRSTQEEEPIKSESVGSVSQWQSYAAKPPNFQVSTLSQISREYAKQWQLTSEDDALMSSFFPPETVRDILSLFNRVINSPHRNTKEYGAVKSGEITDRELRTKIHQAIRRIFSSRLESYTDDNGAMIISAAAGKSKWGTKAGGGRNPGGRNDGGRSSHGKGKLGWMELGGEYLHFTLYKENKDTMEVVSYLARSLKVKPQSFQFAGTKDRRGVTVQRVSVYRLFADRMISVGRTLRNAKIGNFEYQPHGLELGELTGNEFVITLRDCQFENVTSEDIGAKVDAASKIVQSASKELRERGYLNYYGLQRFGTFSTRTDTVGVRMLKGDFKGAVEAVLDFNPASLAAAQDPLSGQDMVSSDDKARAYAINAFKTSGKSHSALETLPRKFSAESNIIRHLGNSSNDYLGALQTIPRNLRLMYVHAYQSLIWNLVASQRWREYGAQVLVGDLVLIDEHKDKAVRAEESERVDADGEIIVQPAPGDSAASADDRFSRARALTQDEIDTGKYTIFDVVLPTPGYDILYPTYIVQTYETVMASPVGGGLNPHDMRRPWKDISLSGSYRKLLSKPIGDITFEVKAYSDDNEQFVETDLDRMKKRSQDHQQKEAMEPVADAMEAKDHLEPTDLEREQGTELSQQKIVVILKLQLGSSQYATMALRELMKRGGVKTYKPDFGGGR